MNLFLFDIDGTLINAYPYSAPPLQKAFFELYSINDFLDKVPHAGTTDIKIARDAIKLATGKDADSDQIEEFLNLFISYLKAQSDSLPAPHILPGVQEILQKLSSDKNNILGLQTGNLEVSAWMKLKKCGLDKYFVSGGFASDSESRPELVRLAYEKHQQKLQTPINSKNVYLLGDTPFDITAGHANGFKVIALASGRFTSNELLEYNPHAVFENMIELKSALNEILY